MNYYKNKLINELLEVYYETFSKTLDTGDFVPEQFNKKIYKYIFKNMKKSFRQVDKEDRKHQKDLIISAKNEIIKQRKSFNLFRWLFGRKKHSEFVKDKGKDKKRAKASGLCSPFDKEEVRAE